MAAILRKTWLLWTLYLLAGIPVAYILINVPKVETLLWINGHHNAFLDQFFKYFTHLGDGLFYIALIVVLFWWNRNAGWKALAAYALTSIVAQVMKNYFFGDALRPRAILNDDSKLHFIDGVEIYFLSSFPSGHTTSAFSIALLLSWLFPSRLNMVLLFFYAVGVAYSRMYLGQHFLTDVAAGSLIGMLVTALVIWVLEKIKKAKHGEIKKLN
jgi:membrane-associated phospholipid phosphatase